MKTIGEYNHEPAAIEIEFDEPCCDSYEQIDELEDDKKYYLRAILSGIDKMRIILIYVNLMGVII